MFWLQASVLALHWPVWHPQWMDMEGVHMPAQNYHPVMDYKVIICPLPRRLRCHEIWVQQSEWIRLITTKHHLTALARPDLLVRWRSVAK